MIHLRYFLELAYNGSAFYGWQVQPGKVTVQGTINQVLSTIFRQSIHVVGCGRTDTGVHASQFFLHFDTNEKAPSNLLHKLNRMLPNEIAVRRVLPVAPEAHARFDAVKRSYCYQIHFHKNPFLYTTSYYCYYSLDIKKMKNVAATLVHYKNFEAVSKANDDVKHSLCSIYSSIITEENQGLRFEISANRFLHNMIRRLMGLLIEVGKGSITEQEVEEVFTTGQRFKRNFVAPAHGLTLTEVKYPYIHDE